MFLFNSEWKCCKSRCFKVN